jgi:hypothetical protein
MIAVLAVSGWAEERPPGINELPAYPEDGQAVGVNPPGFFWTPSDSAAAYRLEVYRGRTLAVSGGPLKSTVYPPFRELAPGEYTWRVVYLDAEGGESGSSVTRRFTVPASAPTLLMPDVREMRKRLDGFRPRLYLNGDRLAEIRSAAASGRLPSLKRLLQAADAALGEEPYAEPPARIPGSRPGEDWLRTFTPGKIGSAHAARTALAYRITGKDKYLESARRWMRILASWDPRGITSHGIPLPEGGIGNDEASMPMLERMSLTWDWVGGHFTPEERERILAVMTERGNQVLRKLESDDFLSHPFNNHSGRAIAFLGQAGLAFLGDIPDAEQWLDYVLRAYLTSYPPWGGDAGGWSQGLSYWSFYVYCHTNFAVALREAAGVDLFRLPFFRNTGYFPVYFQPPYSPAGAFGDGGYHRPSEVGGLLTELLADALRDPILKWQARGVATLGEKNATRWREWFLEDLYAVLREGREPALAPQSPAGLDESRYLPDIGWVAMHSALGSAADDVWALFKSSPIGTASHSHADHNTFQLYAYGEALAIDSGYYPSYGTPHDNLYTRQTRAHNGILVNGRGMPPHTWNARGAIGRYERKGPITIVRGEAAEAYNLPQPPSLVKLWRQALDEPLPPMEPRVERFTRTLAFAASRERPVLVVHDRLKTTGPAGFDWLLHAAKSMQTGEDGSIRIENGAARAAVRLMSSEPFAFHQKTGFPIQPEFSANTAYVMGEESFADQWRLTARTARETDEVSFLAVFVPYRASAPEPVMERVDAGGAGGFRIGGTEVTATPDYREVSVRAQDGSVARLP